MPDGAALKGSFVFRRLGVVVLLEVLGARPVEARGELVLDPRVEAGVGRLSQVAFIDDGRNGENCW